MKTEPQKKNNILNILQVKVDPYQPVQKVHTAVIKLVIKRLIHNEIRLTLI